MTEFDMTLCHLPVDENKPIPRPRFVARNNKDVGHNGAHSVTLRGFQKSGCRTDNQYTLEGLLSRVRTTEQDCILVLRFKLGLKE